MERDRGSALVFAVWLILMGALGAIAIPKAVTLADGLVARSELTSAAHLLQGQGVPRGAKALETVLQRDDPGLELSGTPVAGTPSVLPGPVGVSVHDQKAVLVIRTPQSCYKIIVSTSTARLVTTAAQPCKASSAT
jgi:hypothetical protein